MVKFFQFMLIGLPLFGTAQEVLNIAVTASFKPVLEALAEPFEAQTTIHLNLSSASTGVLFQQISSGAPFDVFFAADNERPPLLAQQLSISEKNLYTYAIGKLVLVSHSKEVLSVDDLTHYADRVVIANPAHAPYGVAAKKVLDDVGYTGERVLANNVTQARQYLSLGLANVGLIAASVAQGFEYVVDVDPSRYQVINQQLLVLKPSAHTQALLTFLATPQATDIIELQGYQLPEL